MAVKAPAPIPQHRLVSAALAAWLALGPNAAAAVTAQDTARARELGQEAAELFRAGQYEAALEKFTEANRLVPHPNLDVNIGRAYEKLEQFDQALIHCKIALNAPGVPEATRSAAQQCVERMQKLVVRPIVKLGSRPAGATIRVDGRVVGETPWRGEVEPGDRRFELSLPGYATSTRSLTAQRGQVHALDVTLTADLAGSLLTVTSTPTGALVLLDEEEIGRTPLRQFQLDARTYTLEVRAPGYAPSVGPLSAESGRSIERVVTLLPLGGVPEASGPRPMWPGWAMVGTSAAALGSGGYFGYVAFDKERQADQLARTSGAPEDQPRYNALVADMDAASLASDLLLVSGGVLLTGGLAWLLWPEDEAAKANTAPPADDGADELSEPSDDAL
jgi:hypothetical protein